MAPTYAGLLEGDGVGGLPQGVDRRHVDLVGDGGEDLGETDTAAVLVVRIFLHLQRVQVVSVEEEGEDLLRHKSDHKHD